MKINKADRTILQFNNIYNKIRKFNFINICLQNVHRFNLGCVGKFLRQMAFWGKIKR